MSPSPDEMAAWVIERLDMWMPLHRLHSHLRPDPRCPWCAITRARDMRSDEEILIANAGALT